MNEKLEYYPVELLHWSGMQDKHLCMVEDILNLFPEYINTVNNHQDNALIIATRVNNIKIVKYLLDKTQIDCKQKNKEGNFFMIAIKYGHENLVKMVMEEYLNKVDLEQKNYEGKTFAHLAAKKGYDFIFENQDFIAPYIHIKDDFGQSCLYDSLEGYVSHKNFWCFDLIQEHFSEDNLKETNKEKMNILDFFYKKKLVEFSTVTDLTSKKSRAFTLAIEDKEDIQEIIDKPYVSEQIMENIKITYAPILNLLEQKLKH